MNNNKDLVASKVEDIKLNVYQKLAISRLELQAREIKKSGTNKYAGFKYFELSDVMPHINEIFAKIGLLGKYELNNNYAELVIFNTDDPDDLIEFSITADKENCEIKMGQDKQSMGMQPVQRLGSVITYSKRYLYFTALEITENDVIEALKQETEEEKQQRIDEQKEADRIALEETIARNALLKIIRKYSYTMKDVAKEYGLNNNSSTTDFVRVANLIMEKENAKEPEIDINDLK